MLVKKIDIKNIEIIEKTQKILELSILNVDCCEIALRPNQFCNICEVNVSDVESQEDLDERVAAATLIGSLQASYTDFHYLRPIWKRTTEKDALLGISGTGIGSGKVLEFDLELSAKNAVEINKIISKKIGINSASRITCIKPAGTTSIVLGSSSGIHAWHDNFYLRRVRVNKNEAIYTYLSIYHPELLEDDFFRPHDTAIISIPQKSPEGSILRSESPIDLLERVKLFYEKWILPGHLDGQNTHNVSATINIDKNSWYRKENGQFIRVKSEDVLIDAANEIDNTGNIVTPIIDEWKAVGEWMWENRNSYNGLSCLPYDGGSYIQSPFETIDEVKFNELFKTLTDVDLTKVVELSDETEMKESIACGTAGCEIV